MDQHSVSFSCTWINPHQIHWAPTNVLTSRNGPMSLVAPQEEFPGLLLRGLRLQLRRRVRPPAPPRPPSRRGTRRAAAAPHDPAAAPRPRDCGWRRPPGVPLGLSGLRVGRRFGRLAGQRPDAPVGRPGDPSRPGVPLRVSGRRRPVLTLGVAPPTPIPLRRRGDGASRGERNTVSRTKNLFNCKKKYFVILHVFRSKSTNHLTDR